MQLWSETMPWHDVLAEGTRSPKTRGRKEEQEESKGRSSRKEEISRFREQKTRLPGGFFDERNVRSDLSGHGIRLHRSIFAFVQLEDSRELGDLEQLVDSG